MKRFTTILTRALAPAILLVALGAPILVTSCDDPFNFDWVATVDTVTLYSLARPEYLDLPAAYDFGAGGGPRIVEVPAATPLRWDLAFTEEDGEFVALPAGLFQGFDIEPGLQKITGTTFEELAEAPSDGYVTDQSTALETGALYAVKSRRTVSGCTYYAKFEVLALNADGTVEFESVENPLCNDRELIPK